MVSVVNKIFTVLLVSFLALWLSRMKLSSVCDKAIDLRTGTGAEEGRSTFLHLGALNSTSMSYKYGILWVGVGISQVLFLEVQMVLSQAVTAVSTE